MNSYHSTKKNTFLLLISVISVSLQVFLIAMYRMNTKTNFTGATPSTLTTTTTTTTIMTMEQREQRMLIEEVQRETEEEGEGGEGGEGTNKSSLSQRNHGQKILLLAGPHKTGSSSMQDTAMKLALTLNNEWNWIAPPELRGLYKNHRRKYFSALIKILRREREEEMRYFRSDDVTKEDIIPMFQNEINKQWYDKKRNLMMGGEGLDYITASSSMDENEAFFNDVLSIMPKNYKAYTTVVVKYRTSRINHLISLWKQEHPDHKLSFYHFLQSSESEYMLHRIDSLRMTQMFLQRDMRVKLIDMSGMTCNQMELYEVLGCELMEEICDPETGVPLTTLQSLSTNNNNGRDSITTPIKETLKEYFGTPLNIRKTHKSTLNVTQESLDKIDSLLVEYDCNFQHILDHENLSVLHMEQLERNMKGCSSSNTHPSSHHHMDRHELWSKINLVLE